MVLRDLAGNFARVGVVWIWVLCYGECGSW